MNDDLTLLREFAENNSESAFTEIVSRHVNLVYSIALRQTRDAHLAEEITQAVFIILARKANSLGDKIILSGWLCRTARYAGANALTIQRRRQKREQEAFMQSQFESGTGILPVSETEMWNEISPLLDTALEKLNRKDHDALVLRFFENKNFAEVGAAMGASESAAKMRVNRALEKLRKIFGKRGVSSTTAILAGTISANSIQAAPIGLAKAISAVAIAKGATASTSTLTLIKGALKIMAWTKMKTAAVVSVAVILAAGTTTSLVIKHEHQKTADDSDFTTPEAAFKSAISVMSHGDINKISSSFSPEFWSQFTETFSKGKSEKELSAMFIQDATMLGDVQIVSNEFVSSDESVLHIYSARIGNESQPMKKIGGEWKINGNLTSDNLNQNVH